MRATDALVEAGESERGRPANASLRVLGEVNDDARGRAPVSGPDLSHHRTDYGRGVMGETAERLRVVLVDFTQGQRA